MPNSEERRRRDWLQDELPARGGPCGGEPATLRLHGSAKGGRVEKETTAGAQPRTASPSRCPTPAAPTPATSLAAVVEHCSAIARWAWSGECAISVVHSEPPHFTVNLEGASQSS